MKIRILFLPILACCCFGFYFWYRSLRPSSETGGLFSVTLAGVQIEGIAGHRIYQTKMDVYVVNRANGQCRFVAKRIAIEGADISVSPSGVVRTCVIVAVNPIQACQLRLAEKEGTLHLALPTFTDGTGLTKPTWNDLFPAALPDP